MLTCIDTAMHGKHLPLTRPRRSGRNHIIFKTSHVLAESSSNVVQSLKRACTPNTLLRDI